METGSKRINNTEKNGVYSNKRPRWRVQQEHMEQHGYYHVYPAIVYNIEIEINAGM